MSGRWSLIALTALLLGGAWLFWSSANDQGAAEKAYEAAGSGEGASEAAPGLTRAAAKGRVAFNAVCARCHGRDAAGGEAGPPLIHRIYEPAHHGDQAFQLAVKNGVRAHHWKFGDMPPQPDVSPAQVETIIAFIRETQRANGID